MKPKKPKKSLAWSHKATPRCSVAIKQLLALKEQSVILRKKIALLQSMIIKEGGGLAHGVRAAIRHQNASISYRRVKVKQREFVVFLEIKGSTDE